MYQNCTKIFSKMRIIEIPARPEKKVINEIEFTLAEMER